MPAPVVRVGTSGDGPMVGEAITEAFLGDPLTHWVVPVLDDWPKVLPGYFGAAAAAAAEAGTVYVAGDYDAVAVWFDLSSAPPPAPPDEPAPELVELCGPYTTNFHVLEHLMHQAHPQGPAHHQLAFLAVRKDLRGRGVGGHLLELHHARLDQAGLGAYLDASNPDSRRLYLRAGYQELGEPFQPPDGPPVWPMWRPPGG